MPASGFPLCRHRHRARVNGDRQATGLCERCSQERPPLLPADGEPRCTEGEAAYLEVDGVQSPDSRVLMERWQCGERRGHPSAAGPYPCAYGESTVPDQTGEEA